MQKLLRPLVPCILAALLVGCGSGGKDTDTGEIVNAPSGGGKITGNLEVQAFKGGYDIDFYKKAGEEFAAQHPELKVTVDGSPKVWDKLQPRFLDGSPPDLTYPGWGMAQWQL